MKIAGMHGSQPLYAGSRPVSFGQTIALETDGSSDRFERKGKPSGMGLSPTTLGSALMMALALTFGDPTTSQAQQAEIIPLPFHEPDAEASAQMRQLTQVLGLAGKDTVTVQDYRDAFFKRYLQGFGETILDLKAENPELPISAEQYAATFDQAFFRPFARQFGLSPDSSDEHSQMAFFRLMEWTVPQALDVRNSAEVNDLAQARIRKKLDMGKDAMQWWMLASLVLENPAMTDVKIKELFEIPENSFGVFPARPEPRPQQGNGLEQFDLENPPFQKL